MPPAGPGRPLLRVVRGRPGPDELAAATVALLAVLRTRPAPPGAAHPHRPAPAGPPPYTPGTRYRAPGAWTARHRFTHHD
ncbi:acyl-CoA carboxylase epsilon subunit [Streptomyces murinus]|uniref:acyl-CoA carboxylase epsilon subunit n=1 Tax=Streptomyces murinus TaxID=33900 RepID=UPI00372C2C1D